MKDKTKKIAIGAVIAAAAGYIAGVLTAPKSGRETRKDIKNAGLKAKTEAEKKLKELHSELDKLLDQAKDKAKKAKNVASEEFAAAVTKAQFAKDKARNILSALHDGDADDKDLKKAIEEVKQSITHLKSYLAKPSTPKKP